MFKLCRYTKSEENEWNSFVRESKNGTFLLDRRYIEYHGDRFEDYSLTIRDGSALAAVLPAHRMGDGLFSHQGLTYGGLVLPKRIGTVHVLTIFDKMLQFLRAEGISCLQYKTIPTIYHRFPAEEDRYALFRYDAKLIRRDTLSVVDMHNKLKWQERRRRGVAKAVKHGVNVAESNAWSEYWSVLTARLQDSHQAAPTHTVEEIELLRSRFPENIRLFAATCGNRMVAGVVIYVSDKVAHCQYIAATDEGRACSALDLLFAQLIENVFPSKAYFDFGISNESQGKILNTGLSEFKEGFGARTIVHDHYSVPIQ